MDGEPPQEEDFSQIPLVERSEHKNWKARVSAYTEAIAKAGQTASDTDPFFRPFVSDGSLLKKWCLDANAVAQEKGIEAVFTIVKESGETSARTRSDVVPALVDKALGAVKAGTKKKGVDTCAMYVEVENGGEGVMMDLISGFDSKQPKVIVGSLSCLKEITEMFGVPAMGNIKPLLKALPKAFGHSDKNVRAEASALVIVLYTYLGTALLPSLSDLKPVQLTDLQKSFDAIQPGTAKPTRWTRRVQRERAAAEAAGDGDDGEGPSPEEAAAIDPLSLIDPVDVLAQFPPDLMESLSSTKWKDRVDALVACNVVLDDPKNIKISDSNVDAYSNLAQTLGTKCKSDSNVNVVMEAAKVLEGLAKGLGRSFGRYRGVTMSGLLERLKERKANVVEALGKALDAIFSSTTFTDIAEDVLTSLKSKNPQVKEGTLKFLHRSLCTTRDAPSKDQVKPLAESLVALLGDSVEPVRTSAADCLGTMMKILGERTFNPYIEKVGELQMNKVKDAFEKAEIKYKVGGSKAAAAKPAVGGVKKQALPKMASSPPIKSATKFDDLVDEFAPPKKAPPGRFAAKPKVAPPADDLLDDFAPPAKAPPSRFASKPPAARALPSSPPKAAVPVKRPTPTASAGPSKPTVNGGPSKTLAVSPSEPVKYRFSSEDAAAKAEEQIPATYHAQLADAAWKVRLEAAKEMVKWVGEEDGAEKVESEVMMRFLGKTPGWTEKNFQVSAELYQVMALMAEKSPTFGKPSAALVIGHLSDKLGDMKLKKPAGDALTVFAEKTSLAFVLAQAYDTMTKQKAVKAQADALTWIRQQLLDFGMAGIPLRDLVTFIKAALGSANAAVRSSATAVLVTVRMFIGPDVAGFLEDLNPQLLTTINSEFDKVAGQAPPEPTKTSADLKDAAQTSGKGNGKGGDPLDDLLPRVDLDKLVSSTTVIADSKSEAWKTRMEAFRSLSSVLEVKSNSRLKPNMGEIGGVLKKAVADTNITVKMLGLNIISKIAAGMGQAFDKHTKTLMTAVCSVCADQKATTRSAALASLSAMADAAGSLDSMFTGLGAALESPNPVLRASVLGWVADRLKEDPPSASADLQPLAGPVVNCLEDRNGDVRKGASLLLPFVVQNAGVDYVLEQTSKLKPASKATIIPLINNARPAAAQAPPKSSASAAPPRPAKAPLRPSAPASPAPASVSVPVATKSFGLPSKSLAMKPLAARPASSQSQPEDRPMGLPTKTRLTLQRPASVASTYHPAPSASRSTAKIPPFVTDTSDARLARLKKDSTRWVMDASPKPDLSEYLLQQMEHHASPEAFALLFSKDHKAEEDFMAGLSAIVELYDERASSTFGLAEEEIKAVQTANFDLALKYAALKLYHNNTQLANKCLEVLAHIVDTLPSLTERFSDVEAKLFVPALIFKLGDAKFVPKLTPILESLDKIIASSQLVQMLVHYGLEEKSGKTCKNESLQLIEKAYKKRGTILRTSNDRAFYEAVSKCISDSGTRNAALSVMALLQLQGSSASLDQVVDKLPQGSKDMLANRRATMATHKTVGVPPVLAKASMDSLNSAGNGTPVKMRRPLGYNSPAVSRLAKDTGLPSSENSPQRSTQSPSGIARPKSLIGSPSTARTISTASGQPRPNNLPPSKLQPTDLFAVPKRTAMQPLMKSNAANRPSNGFAPSKCDVVSAAINDIRHDDPVQSIDALKHLQMLLKSEPEMFMDNAQTLADTLNDEMERAFTPPENLLNETYFRVVKHLIQTYNGFSSHQDLMRRLNYDDLYALLSCLSLRLVQSDRMGGTVQELSKFINMILVQALSTPDRLLVFKAMFNILLSLTKDFTKSNVTAESEVAAHADLVLKCLWKRCKILNDDFRSGRLRPGAVLSILEDFMQGVGPAEYRRRATAGIALGDMPLRTVKTMIQRILVYAKETDQEIYAILLSEFGDRAAETIVYTYVFRLAGHEANHAPAPLRTRTPDSLAGHSPPVTATEEVIEVEEVAPPKEQSEAERLVRNLRTGDQHQQLDALHAYITEHPEKETEVQAVISAQLSLAVQTYVRRMLESRKNKDNASPSRTEPPPASPLRSPSRHSTQEKPTPRRSLAPRPSSLAVDKSAPVDEQLAHVKLIFARGALSASTSQDGNNPLTGDDSVD
ncbi:cytoskeleton-associated protein 5, partial [Tremellales sp. Uapishka_1]